MSRTLRKLPLKAFFRRPATHQSRVIELKASEELNASDFHPSNRVKSRIRNIPSDWDDLNIAAYDETPRCKW